MGCVQTVPGQTASSAAHGCLGRTLCTCYNEISKISIMLSCKYLAIEQLYFSCVFFLSIIHTVIYIVMTTFYFFTLTGGKKSFLINLQNFG